MIHGVDWDEAETPAGMAEVFKRLHQSGSNARFVGVSWPSNMGRDRADLFFGTIPVSKPAPIDYYEDVISAFVSAKYVRNELVSRGLDGPDTVLLVHSLGNILASSMIQDHGLDVGAYFLLNAAVPVESYQGEIQNDISREELVANPYFQDFNNTDAKPDGIWVNVSSWTYQPAGTDISQSLIAPPFTPGTHDMAVLHHAKLLAEAIPALSVAAGGHQIAWMGPTSDDINVDLHTDKIIADVVNCWPSGSGGRCGKEARWLHGDYKDVAYIYAKGLYDRITNEGKLQ